MVAGQRSASVQIQILSDTNTEFYEAFGIHLNVVSPLTGGITLDPPMILVNILD